LDMRRGTVRSRQTSVESDFNDENRAVSEVSSSVVSLKVKAKRARTPKRTLTGELPAVKEEERGEEEDEIPIGQIRAEKADKEEQSSIAEMLQKLCESDSPSKALMKRLMAEPEKLFAEATINHLRRVLWTTAIIASPEGQKLANLCIFEKIGIEPAVRLLKKRALKDDINPQDCKHMGELLLLVHKTAVRRDKDDGEWDGEKGPLTEQAINAWTEIADASMLIPGKIGEKFLGMFLTLSSELHDKSKNDSLIYRAVEPVLWRYLRAPHDQVRYAASMLLVRIFPVVEKGSQNSNNNLDVQLNHFMDMLVDECVEIRKEGSKRILRALAHYYPNINVVWIKKLLSQIVDVNSKDSIPAVRAAVLEGFAELLSVSEAINATDIGLRAMLPRLIEDRSEKVRLAAVDLLLKLRCHRHIRYYKVVPMDEIMARLECESSDAIRKKLVELVITSFLPKSATADEKNERIALLVKYGRNAALSFHRLVVPLNLVTLEDAVAHLKNLCIVVYKNWRKGVPESDGLATVEGDMTTSFDTSIVSNTSIADASAMAIPSLDEEAFVFRRDKVLLECAVVLWASIAKELKKPSHESERKVVDKLMSKIFKKMFASFRQTSLLGTVMCIGSLLPSNMLEEYSIQILTILKEKSVDDEILEPYLEAGASWRIDELMEIIRDGLYELPSVLPALTFTSSSTRSPVKKRPRKNKLSPVERIRQALHYLKYSLGHEPISSRLIAECRAQLEECFEALSHVHEVVDAYLDSIDDGDEELKTLTGEDILSLYESATVLAVLMMEIPTTSAAAAADNRSTRSGRSASVASTGAAPAAAAALPAADQDTEDEETPSASPYSIFFFASMHWLEQSLLPRIGKCSSIERDKEQLQIRLAKVTLQHTETVLAACSRPPRAPTAAAMTDLIKRFTAPGGGGSVASSEEEEDEEGAALRRRSSLASSVGTDVSAPDPPQKSYLERLSAMLKALMHVTTPVVLLRSLLRLWEIIMGMDNETGAEARQEAYDILRAAFGIVRRAADSPIQGEQLRQGHVDALLAFTKVVIAKWTDGPAQFPYSYLMGQLRVPVHRLMMAAIAERGIEDVSEHTYELAPLVELFLHRFIFRHDTIYSTWREHLETFTMRTPPLFEKEKKKSGDEEGEGRAGEEESEEEEEGDEEEREARREKMAADNQDHFMRFVVGVQLLRLSAPELRKSIIKEKKCAKARRSIQSDVDTPALFARLDEWKRAIRMDDGTETILREMIGP
ncbi:capg-2, partial [Pristionchus pacificus]